MTSGSAYRDGPEKPGTLYVGFDLGTTNSACAVFDGEKLDVVRTESGGFLTPSVVRLDKSGKATVGERAQRLSQRDPQNVKREFKRLMGGEHRIHFPAAEVDRTPIELSAEVLRSLLDDVKNQTGIRPTAGVVSVPALFEIPQNTATAEAARLAGLERVELIQEPIASALAAGWSADEHRGRWLVYDLGGGTFDASLLERDGDRLRVVDHDGDNFLGGRDIDAAIVDHLIERIASAGGPTIRRDESEHQDVLEQLKRLAEELKVTLSRQERASIEEAEVAIASPPALNGQVLPLEGELTRATLNGLAEPVLSRTVDVCRRLLEATRTRNDELQRIVLVGGPTLMPVLRERVARDLNASIAAGANADPMTLVAQGAALFAATSGLSAAAAIPASGAATGTELHPLSFAYPPVTADPTPVIVGRDPSSERRVHEVSLHRTDGAFSSDTAKPADDGTFVIGVELVLRRSNTFEVRALDASGTRVDVSPTSITLIHGIALSDPPLSRSIGIALADDRVKRYFDKGTPLPARRTFRHETVEALARGSDKSLLRVPIVQGELERAHLCRLVGQIDIPAASLKDNLPAGATVAVTLELDRGGRLLARAEVPQTGQVFEQVARLLVPEADVETLEAGLAALRQRLTELRREAFRAQLTEVVGKLIAVESIMSQAAAAVDAARGGDADAGQRARRLLIDAETQVDGAELDKQWPELEQQARSAALWATGWVSEQGSPTEQRMLGELTKLVDEARERKDPDDLSRHLKQLRQLAYQCYQRDPDVWSQELDDVLTTLHEATDVRKAHRLAAEASQARERGDLRGLRRGVEQLWALMPPDAQARRRSYDSGLK